MEIFEFLFHKLHILMYTGFVMTGAVTDTRERLEKNSKRQTGVAPGVTPTEGQHSPTGAQFYMPIGSFIYVKLPILAPVQ